LIVTFIGAPFSRFLRRCPVVEALSPAGSLL
jgi:hypothetical protein